MLPLARSVTAAECPFRLAAFPGYWKTLRLSANSQLSTSRGMFLLLRFLEILAGRPGPDHEQQKPARSPEGFSFVNGHDRNWNVGARVNFHCGILVFID